MYINNYQKAECEDNNNAAAEKQLENINIFFSAYGNFLIGILGITQYFLKGNPLFGIITLSIVVVILTATYGISYYKGSVNNKKIWRYITLCAMRLGPINPFFLILGIIFALNPSFEIVLVWIGLEVVQVLLYIFEFRKGFPDLGRTFTKRFLGWLKGNVALVITIMLAILFGVLWFESPETSRYNELWLNLSAGFIASSITIAVIDRILRRQKDVNERPLRQAMYRDIQLFTSRFVLMWQEMYLHSVEARKDMVVN